MWNLPCLVTICDSMSLAHQYSRSLPPFWEWSFVSNNPELDGRLLDNHSTDVESVTWASLGWISATLLYEVCLWRISIHGVHHPSESSLFSLTILNSMADPSTTTLPILNQSLEHHWPRQQLHAGISYVSGASVFMEFTTLLRVVFCF